MHFALGLGISCVTIFNCTSPWEIHDYGIQRKIISPLLEQFFYKRDFDKRATTAISIEEVFAATMEKLTKQPIGELQRELKRLPVEKSEVLV
jgi:hypothetical protein